MVLLFHDTRKKVHTHASILPVPLFPDQHIADVYSHVFVHIQEYSMPFNVVF